MVTALTVKACILAALIGALTGCVGNKQLYCGVRDLGDTQQYQDSIQTVRRAK